MSVQVLKPTLRPPSPPSADIGQIARLVSLLKLWLFVCAGFLMAVTYRLWLPPNWSDFPQIPALELLTDAPPWCDYVALITLMLAMTLAAASLQFNAKNSIERQTTIHRASIVTLFIGGATLVLLNQHRLQAWFYQLLIYCVVFLLHDHQQQLRWLRNVMLSVYFYSAIGKFDFAFAHSTGQELLAAIFETFGMDLNQWSSVDRICLALGLPLLELILACALLYSLRYSAKNQRQGSLRHTLVALPGVLACLFHLVLAGLMLWQLKHSWAVVLWNLQFAGQAIGLFVFWELRPIKRRLDDQPPAANSGTVPTASVDTLTANESWSRMTQHGLGVILFTAILMPVFERVGYWDHWPSWALYAPHSSRAVISVAPFATQQLPSGLRAVLDQQQADGPAVQLPIGLWSLESLGVPVYPQSRFQLGIARDLVDRFDSQYSINAELLSSANRFTGDRQSKILRGREQMELASRRFWLNTRPRSTPANSTQRLPE